MEINPLFRLDGRSYDRDSLPALCATGSDQSTPEWKREIFKFIELFLDSSGPEITQYTSGTTGDPGKHILLRDSMWQSARKTLDFFELLPGEKALLCLPIRYIAGKMMVVRALLGGLDLILTEPSARPLRELSQSVSFAALVPLQVHESLKHGDKLSKISKLIVGGGEMGYSSKKVLECLSETAVFESFGMTETYTHFALKRINGVTPDLGFRLLEGASVSLDHRNCLVVHLEGVTQKPVTTNDLVEIDSSGRGFKWLGRYDHVINTGGIKLIPELLEEQIRRSLGTDCLLLAEPDERLGSRLILVMESSLADPPVEEWHETLKSILSPYELPKRIVTLKEIPRNLSMKMDRRATQKILLT
jgi:O-succinylbenzoic acid--CoA ligase